MKKLFYILLFLFSLSGVAFERPENFERSKGNNADFIQKVIVPKGTRLQRSRALGNSWGRGCAEQFEILKLKPNEFQPVHYGEGVTFR